MASILKLDTLQNLSGAKALDIHRIATDAAPRYVRQAASAADATAFNFTTAWALGPNFGSVGIPFKAGSLIELFYHIPGRNDSAGWGGGYVEVQISYDGGTTWAALGNGGYDGGTMNQGGGAIGTYNNTILLDPGKTADFTVSLRAYCRSFEGTYTVNGAHDINVSATGVAQIAAAANQHWAHVVVKELALLRGS